MFNNTSLQRQRFTEEKAEFFSIYIADIKASLIKAKRIYETTNTLHNNITNAKNFC